MDFLFDLLQALGIGAAIGIRPGLPVLLVGALASADRGVDFDGTDFAFLESWPFLLAVIALVTVLDILRRRRGDDTFDAPPALYAVGAIALALAALEGAGSLADRDNPAIVGALAAAAAAVLGFLSARSLFGRVRKRLDAQAAGALPVYGEAAALAAAGLSVLFPPLAILVLVALAWLMSGGKRREGEKYAGLRILR